jgi:hypothetical protein
MTILMHLFSFSFTSAVAIVRNSEQLLFDPLIYYLALEPVKRDCIVKYLARFHKESQDPTD